MPGPSQQSSASAPAIRLSELVVAYGATKAVDGLSTAVARSAITTILGPNGAGKTTTLEVCEGLRRPTSGIVEVLGADPWRAPASHRTRVGVMLQRAGLPSGIRAIEALRSAADLYADPYPVDQLVDRLRLNELGRRPFRRLSGGEQQRVGLAVALVGRPDLLLLDEPTSGMDPAARNDTWHLLRDFAAVGTTVVVTTHQIDEAEAFADHLVLLAHGRVAASGSVSDLVDGPPEVRFHAPALAGRTLEPPGGLSIESTAPGHFVMRGPATMADATLVSATLSWCGDEGVVPDGLAIGRPSLESVVLGLVDWEASR